MATVNVKELTQRINNSSYRVIVW